MSIEGYFAWLKTLRRLDPHERLEAVLRHYPGGAPTEAVRTLMNGISGKALDRLVAPLKRQGKVGFVYLVDTTCALIEDEDQREAQRATQQRKAQAWLAEGRRVREGTRDQKLMLWTG